MAACLGGSLGFSSLSADSLKTTPQVRQNPQPIISSSSPSSLRRTLSADMSSEKWKAAQAGLKKVSSLENLHFHDDDEYVDGSGSGAFEETERAPMSQTDIWSSILTQKAAIKEEEDANNTAQPYVHPLVKRSASSLSEKSLEICTEPLGSETGSDGFSPEPACDSDQEEYKEVAVVVVETEQEKVALVGSGCCYVKTTKAVVGVAPARSFPPPLPSLAHRGDGSNVQMRSHRHDGRLVLEAVSVPSINCFKAERQDGRLLLTFSGCHVSGSEKAAGVEMDEDGSTEGDEDELIEQGDVIEDHEESEEEGYDDVDTGDDEMACGDGRMMSYVASAHKFLGLTRNSMATWPRSLNKVVNTLEDEEEVNGGYLQPTTTLARSLPMRAKMAHGMNPYICSCRSKPGPGPTVVEVVVEGKRAGKEEEELIPLFLRGCNLQQQQPRRSLLLWEPHCIAT